MEPGGKKDSLMIKPTNNKLIIKYVYKPLPKFKEDKKSNQWKNYKLPSKQ